MRSWASRAAMSPGSARNTSSCGCDPSREFGLGTAGARGSTSAQRHSQGRKSSRSSGRWPRPRGLRRHRRSSCRTCESGGRHHIVRCFSRVRGDRRRNLAASSGVRNRAWARPSRFVAHWGVIRGLRSCPGEGLGVAESLVGPVHARKGDSALVRSSPSGAMPIRRR